ncbi:hypothetical protein Tco_0992905 [Tanacetum coccineum]|uniref:Uncharacterized protein n=1 Tax=Tanacetum coccineum TaxID=301880 RepID=A0ABQ5F3F0_9ASTR
MTVRPQPPMAASPKALITAVAATLPLPSPPPSPLTSYSSPLPQISSPPLPVSPSLPISPSPLPASPTHSLGYRAAMIRLRTESPSTFTTTTYHTLTYQSIYGHDESCRTIHLLFSTSIEDTTIRDTTTSTYTVTYIITTSTSTYTGLIDRILHEVHVPPQKRLCIALGPRRDLDREIGYRITNVLEDPDDIAEEIPDARSVMSGQLKLLHRDRRFHARTARLMESEARVSHEA